MMMVVSTVMVSVMVMIVEVVVPPVDVPHGNNLLMVVELFVSVFAAKTHFDGLGCSNCL
jgi:hypothetical protein